MWKKGLILTFAIAGVVVACGSDDGNEIDVDTNDESAGWLMRKATPTSDFAPAARFSPLSRLCWTSRKM